MDLSCITPQVDRILRIALDEDLGPGDVTSEAVVPADARARARFLIKEPGVLAGLVFARRVFELLDPSCSFEALASEGSKIEPGQHVAVVTGPARSLLSGERTALNLVQRLSGIATRARAFVDAAAGGITILDTRKTTPTLRVLEKHAVALLEGSRTRVLDTRKTSPGLRALEKYAVRQGGGTNHRYGLYDAVLIKNNHLKLAPPAEAIRRARAHAPSTCTVEIEVESLEQLREALSERPDIILLDNMPYELMEQALVIIDGRARVEVSGNVTHATLPRLGKLGADYVSMGSLTHSSVALDISLRFELVEPQP